MHDKVQNNLLKLDAVAENRKRILCDQTGQFDLACAGKRRNNSKRFANQVIQVEVFSSKGAFFSRLLILRMISLAHVRSSLRISARISFTASMSGFGDFKIACAVSGIGQNSTQRLVDFVCNRGGQFASGRESCMTRSKLRHVLS